MLNLKSLKIEDDLYFNCTYEKRTERTQQTVDEPTSYIFLVDRSGSMYRQIDSLISDLQNLVHKLEYGDYFTFGYFSSEGHFDFPIRGLKISNNQDVINTCLVLDNYRSVLGTTCFSEIMGNCLESVKNFSVFSNKHILWLLTDGYPVVSNYPKEIKTVLDHAFNLGEVLTTSVYVGYGDYYNEQLLKEIAVTSGGVTVHSADMDEVAESLDKAIELGRIESNVKTDSIILRDCNLVEKFGVSTVIENDVHACRWSTSDAEDPSTKVLNVTTRSLSDSEYDAFYFFTDAPLREYEDTQSKDLIDDYTMRAMSAHALLSVGEIGLAADVLAGTEDVNLYNLAAGAYTTADVGEAKKKIIKAITSEHHRFKFGSSSNLTSSTGGVCALDLFNYLASDQNIFFDPKHEDFKYRSIGGSPKTKAGYPKFLYADDTSIPFGSVEWHSELLNLNVKARFDGYISVPEEGQDLGLPEQWKTNIYRTYTLVRDGNLCIDSLPLVLKDKNTSLSKITDMLKATSVRIEHDSKTGAYVLSNLRSLPVINRAFIKKNRFATVAYKAQVELMQCKAELKVLNYLLKEREDKPFVDENLTPEQDEYLKSLGVSSYGYNPPTEDVREVDKLEVTKFFFKPKTRGYGSLPKVDSVIANYNSGKANAGARAWMESTYKEFLSASKNVGVNKEIELLKTMIASRKEKQVLFRKTIDSCRMAIVLGKTWFEEFDEFSDFSDSLLAVNDVMVISEIKRTTVPISVPVN